MRTLKYLIVFVSIFLFTSCVSTKMSQMSQWRYNYTPIPETTKWLDIPKYDVNHELNGYPFVFWHFSKQKEQQLNIESAELSSDSLIFRIWITNEVGMRGQPHGLIEIKHDFFKWSANLYAMNVNFNANNISETIVNFEKMEITPKRNDWNFIVDSLYQLKFDILPADEDIPNYFEDNSGYSDDLTYSFEYATKRQYRFYQYNYPGQKSDEFWQAENVLKILDLLDDEFAWHDLIGNSLDSLSTDAGKCKGAFYNYRIDAGAFIPLDNLKNTLGVSPHLGLQLGFPLTERYRVDLGVSVFFPVNSKKMEYFLPDKTISVNPGLGGTVGIWASRIDLLKNCWTIDNRIGAGYGFLQTNTPDPDYKYDYDTDFEAETFFLGFGTSVRKGNVGLSFNYYFVPYNAFKKKFQANFGSQYLTINTYYTF